MAGYIGSKANVSQIDGYVKSEVDTLLGQELNLSGGSMTGHLNFGDNIKIQSGAGTDLQIYHDASHSYIKDAGTGNLRLSATAIELMKVDTSELMASFAQDGAVTLYYDNAAKLATASGGINVMGEITGVTAIRHANSGAQVIDNDNNTYFIINDPEGSNRIKIGDSGDRTTSIRNDTLRFETADGSLGFLMNSSRNVGIGTASPTHKLHVNGTVKVTGTQTFDVDSGGGSYIAVSHQGNESWTWDARSGSGSDDYLDVGISGGTRAMSWHETGNVGIGETTPLDMLSISSSAGNAAIRLKRTDTAIVNDDIYGVINFAGDDSDSNASGIRGFIRGKAQGTGGGMKMEFHTAGGGAALVSDPRMTLNADGQLGIGTTSPNALLHVGGTADTQGSQANPAIQIGSTTGYRLGMYTDVEGGYIENKNGDNGIIFKVKTAGEAMRIDGGTGNVGIGTTNPVAQFAVGGAGRRIEIAGSDGVIRGFDRSASWAAIDFEAASYTFDCGGTLALTIDSSRNATFAENLTTNGAITSSGFVKATEFRMQDGSNLAGGIFKEKTVTGSGSSNDLSFFAESISNGGDIHFMTGGSATPKVTISSLGTTTVNGSYPTTNSVNYVLRLNSTSSGTAVAGHGTGIQFLGERNDGNAQSLALIQAVTSTNSGTSIAADLSFSTGSGGAPSERLRINSSGRQTYNGSSTANGHANFVGEVGSSSKAIMFEHTNGGGECGKIITTSNTAVLSNTSDYRLKENVNYTWDATTRLKQLKPARFNWINDETNTLVDGFLAHEVSSIVPSAVYGEKDGVDEHGNPDWQGIAVTELVPLLVKTIQELEARITELEA